MGWRSGLERLAAKPAMSRITIVSRRIRRGREGRRKHDLPPVRPLIAPLPETPPSLDPVRIAVLALDALGPASMRASYSGKEVRVAVPDTTIAAIFQAALSQTARTRSTDRLIRIVVD